MALPTTSLGGVVKITMLNSGKAEEKILLLHVTYTHAWIIFHAFAKNAVILLLELKFVKFGSKLATLEA